MSDSPTLRARELVERLWGEPDPVPRASDESPKCEEVADRNRAKQGWLRSKLAAIVDRMLERRLRRLQKELYEEVRALEKRVEQLESRSSALHGILEARLEHLEKATRAQSPGRPR